MGQDIARNQEHSKAQYQLDVHLQGSLPLHLEAGKETGYFQYGPYIEYLLHKFGLLEFINDAATTEPVWVAVTFDGGSVSHFLGHVTGGLKLVDSRSKHPRTKDLLFGASGHDKRTFIASPLKWHWQKTARSCTAQNLLICFNS